MNREQKERFTGVLLFILVIFWAVSYINPFAALIGIIPVAALYVYLVYFKGWQD